MAKEHLGFENVNEGINTLLDVYEDIKHARSAESAGGEKIVLTEGIGIVGKNAIGSVKLIGNLGTIVKELKDTQPEEAEATIATIAERFGGSPEAVAALKKIAHGGGEIAEGVESLLELRKLKEQPVE